MQIVVNKVLINYEMLGDDPKFPYIVIEQMKSLD
jgi:hypothetical protein